MERNSAGLYLPVITVAEVEDGIARSRRAGAHAKARRLADWLETVLHLYGSRILPIDIETARQIGVPADHARAGGHDPGLADLAIAAIVRSYVVLTRNVRHFLPLGAAVHDPLEELTQNAPILNVCRNGPAPIAFVEPSRPPSLKRTLLGGP